MRINMRWAPSPPPPPPPPLSSDLQSSAASVLCPLQPLPHTINHPSQLPSNRSSGSFPQDDADDDHRQLMVTGSTKENKAAGLKNSSVVKDAEAITGALPSCFSDQEGGHWLEEDMIFPLKKRRILGMMDHVPSNTSTVFQRELIEHGGNARASRKRTEKKWADHVMDYEYGDDVEWIGAAENMQSDSTRSSGQRCRRENGRGWRCPQPSLAGYYVCEHHRELNKSREMKKQKKKQKKMMIARKFVEAKLDHHHDQPTSANKFTVLGRGVRSYSSDTEDSSDVC